MKRIMILGSPGSGKSTLAKSIGEITGIEVIHLDTLFWAPGWVKVPSEEFRERVKSYVEKESWIIDGNYSGVLDIRLSTADTIIFIDVPRGKCLYRVGKRRFQYSGKTRSDLTAGCDEKIDWEFIKWIWNFSKHSKPIILKEIEEKSQGKEVYYLKNKEDIEFCINHIRKRRNI